MMFNFFFACSSVCSVFRQTSASCQNDNVYFMCNKKLLVSHVMVALNRLNLSDVERIIADAAIHMSAFKINNRILEKKKMEEACG